VGHRQRLGQAAEGQWWVTQITEITGMEPGLGLTIDNGWCEVSDTALAFTKRFVA
jgi:hypothetical protein